MFFAPFAAFAVHPLSVKSECGSSVNKRDGDEEEQETMAASVAAKPDYGNWVAMKLVYYRAAVGLLLLGLSLPFRALNRVGGGDEPPPLTPPDMRGRIRRFVEKKNA